MYSYQLPTYSSISPNHHVVLTFIPFLPSHHSYIPTKSLCPCIHTNHTPFFYSHPLTMSLHSYHTQHFYTPTKSTLYPIILTFLPKCHYIHINPTLFLQSHLLTSHTHILTRISYYCPKLCYIFQTLQSGDHNQKCDLIKNAAFQFWVYLQQVFAS